jgi:polyferredoxin
MQKQNIQRHHATVQRAMIAFGFVVVLFWTLNVVNWALTGVSPGWLLVVYPLVAISGGVAFYIVLPRHARGMARKILLLIVGTFLIGIAYASGRGNMQIEGLFFGLLTGIGLPVVLHYAIGKVFGPFLFGRIWCGWACWYSMVFDLLPYKSGDRTISQRWARLRYVHFFGSLGLVLGLWYGVGYRDGALGDSGQHWFLIGLFLYHAVGIVIAIALRDNRAFCKYLCPVAVPLKATSRYALLKVKGDPSACAACAKRTCVTVCPMNVRIPDYVAQGKRVLSTECILCQECINTCPDNALMLSFGFDAGGKELLDVRQSRQT